MVLTLQLLPEWVSTKQDSWGINELVQCVSIWYRVDVHFEAYNGLVLQEKGFSASASEPEDFLNGMSLSEIWFLPLPSLQETNFHVFDSYSPGNN